MTSAISTALKAFWQKAIGGTEKFSLESRIFHSFSVFAFVILSTQTIVNIWLQVWVSVGITITIFFIQLYLYYISRVKGRLQLAVIVSIVEINLLTCLNYKFEAGITGPALLLFVTSLFMVICVADKKYWKASLIVNLLVVISLISWEYYHPGSTQPYNTRLSMFMNNGLAYTVFAGLLYVGTSQIVNSYNHQKKLTEEKVEEFKQLNIEKDKLLSIVSHDLRSPLNSIQQYFNILSETELGTAERQLLEGHLMRTITNTQELVTNVLNWAKNQLGGNYVLLQRLALAGELQKTVELMLLQAERKNIQLEVDIDSAIVVTADADMLQLVMRNLLNNAVKFSDKDTLVTLRAIANNGLCTISVRDHGIGIAADKQQDIFTLHVKSTYGTANEKGSGLGLVLCREFMQVQGGDIFFTSTEGEGSEFCVTLPCEV